MINDPVAAAPPPSYLYIATLAAALLAVASPILIFPVPALFDYPAHLAREFIIHDLLTRGSFSSMYQLHFAVIPNLGMEAVVLPLLFLGVPIEIAGRIFLILIVLLLGTGTVRLHHALFQNRSFFPLLSLAFIFNPVFMFGFANYLFGFGLALHAFAWWLHARQKPAAAILPVLLVWAIVLFFCHLMAAALLLGLICSYEASLALIERHGAGPSNLSRALMLLAGPVAVIALLYSLAPLSAAPQGIEIHSIGEVIKRIPGRLKALPLHLTAYSLPVDAVVLLALTGILGVGVVAAAPPAVMADAPADHWPSGDLRDRSRKMGGHRLHCLPHSRRPGVSGFCQCRCRLGQEISSCRRGGRHPGPAHHRGLECLGQGGCGLSADVAGPGSAAQQFQDLH
jgi:hypothetical protein